MSPDQLRARTKAFGLRIVRLFRALPRNPEAQVIGKQLLRCGMSVGANYRATCRARSRQEFAAKLGIVVEEADEAIYWLEVLIEADIGKEKRLRDLLAEAHELTAIFTAAQYTSRRRQTIAGCKLQITNHNLQIIPLVLPAPSTPPAW